MARESAWGGVKNERREHLGLMRPIKENVSSMSSHHWKPITPVSDADKAIDLGSIPHDRFHFVTSFHHVGRELTGVMEVSAFARLEAVAKKGEAAASTREFFICSIDRFVITHRTDVATIRDSFRRWIDDATAVALKEFGDRI